MTLKLAKATPIFYSFLLITPSNVSEINTKTTAAQRFSFQVKMLGLTMATTQQNTPCIVLENVILPLPLISVMTHAITACLYGLFKLTGLKRGGTLTHSLYYRSTKFTATQLSPCPRPSSVLLFLITQYLGVWKF